MMKISMPHFTRQGAFAAVSALAVAGSLLMLGSPAQADTPGFTADQESALRTQMASVGIDTPTQDALLAKVNSGVAPDSSQPGAVPVTTQDRAVNGELQHVSIFADGSRTVTAGGTLATSGITPQISKSGCSLSGGWYNNCKISISDWVSNASFIVDYKTSSSGAAKVRDVRGVVCANTIGGCSISGKVKRSTQSSAGPAWAEASYHADIVHIGSGVSGAFGIRVSGKTVNLYEP